MTTRKQVDNQREIGPTPLGRWLGVVVVVVGAVLRSARFRRDLVVYPAPRTVEPEGD